jgi:DNA-binding response OmpR family regulator
MTKAKGGALLAMPPTIRRHFAPAAEPALARIFVVDRDEWGRASMNRLLRHQGHQTSVYASAHEFLLALSSELGNNGPVPPSLVLINSSSLGTEALDIVQAIASHAGGSEAKVIILTRFTDDEDVLSLLRAGASDYIRLPADPEDVRIIVERVSALPLVG